MALSGDNTTNSTLGRAFDDSAAKAPVLGANAYYQLLEKLLVQGKGYGKTEAIAAYRLHNLQLVTDMDHGPSRPQEVEIKPLYVVMDLAEYPNSYVRSLVMQEIALSYARRMVGEGDLNAPDFKGPGVWTAKVASFEFDYNRRDGVDDDGKPLHIYDPNPEAYRLCLPIPAATSIPTQWGEAWEIGAGGTLAVRERDVAALAEALHAVRTKRMTAEEALFTKKPDGTMVAAFDVYGMAPDFLQDNYKPVFLKEETRAIINAAPAVKPAKPAIIRPFK
ncbi:MAG: hypothetical protein PW788_01535 [Micavibrio sp.]|nr:hypothetical protein [Micavibrio sp.]